MQTKKHLISLLLVIVATAVAGSLLFAQTPKTAEVKIKTSVVCGMCKDRIEQGLAYEKGIRDVSLDLKTKIATVNYAPQKTNPATIRNLISKLGYDADSIPADPKAYAKLPACCKKDALPHD